MRNSRDRWTFFKSPVRKVLSSDEVTYWKSALGQILKVGMEFEFNLPERKGSCEGNSLTCPCSEMATKPCWSECAEIDNCKKDANSSRCGNKEKACVDKDCSECKNYVFKCFAVNCSNFVSACETCDKFNTNCESCDYRLDLEKDPESIRRKLSEVFKPVKHYGHLGANGVHSVVTDGSLLGGKGAEVITTGRRTNYWEFYRMSKKIIDETFARGGYVNERCSIHMHVLASYYGSLFDKKGGNISGTNSKITEMERDMPEIVMANFHQLCRRYQNALTWMTMGLAEPQRMTRWEKYRVSILDISAMSDLMRNVASKVEQVSGGNKYGWINYKYLGFSSPGDVNRLHVELRVMDGLMAPSVVAAMACLYHAMMIKAVEISRYGVLEVGDDEWMKNSKKAKNAILNNMKGWGDGDRHSDTSKMSNFQDTFIRESLELVHQLKHALMKIGPAYDVLEKLAERPVSFLRCEGLKWDAVEDYYKVESSQECQLDLHINECIDLRIIDECQDHEEWALELVNNFVHDEVVGQLGLSDKEIHSQVNDFISNKVTDGELIWSPRLGAMVKV